MIFVSLAVTDQLTNKKSKLPTIEYKTKQLQILAGFPTLKIHHQKGRQGYRALHSVKLHSCCSSWKVMVRRRVSGYQGRCCHASFREQVCISVSQREQD